MTDEQVQAYLRKKGWPERVALAGREYLTQSWKDFVDSVEDSERTRNWLIDDYWIKLRMRDLIHEIGCDDRVKEADERFRKILTGLHIKHYERDRQSDYDFWNYGYPRNATGFFLEQIKFHILRPAQGDDWENRG
jgi:hypothetical protein